jgi:hypothetical protein
MNRLLDISTIDFTLPTSWIGKSLCGEVKIRLENLLKCIKAYIHSPLNEGIQFKLDYYFVPDKEINLYQENGAKF